MKINISRNQDEGIFIYFLRINIISLLPTIFLAVGAAYLFPDDAPSPYLMGNKDIDFLWQWIFIGIIIPAVETIFLIYPVYFLFHITKRQNLSAFYGAFPLIFLHFFDGWVKVVVIFWVFFLQAFSCLELKKLNVKPLWIFSFVAGLHAVNNLIGLLALCVDI